MELGGGEGPLNLRVNGERRAEPDNPGSPMCTSSTDLDGEDPLEMEQEPACLRVAAKHPADGGGTGCSRPASSASSRSSYSPTMAASFYSASASSTGVEPLPSMSTTSEDSPSSERRLVENGSASLEDGGVSRQQLLSGPCPVCSDRISGFHYGIFSCESCKGFFKRTVQNKKNYVCMRGGGCHITVVTRKKCPACRFDKCLKMGMKLEAIREDRTRGGRSTYHCPYSLPPGELKADRVLPGSSSPPAEDIPPLIQDILSVEHLWHVADRGPPPTLTKNDDHTDHVLGNLCVIADHRLYKIVKWCKSLPLFRDIEIDDQISLLINSWCELLLLSCCYRSMDCPEGEIRVSAGRTVTLRQARALGLGPFLERMLSLTAHLRRLQLDHQEYVCLKVILLLTSDASSLKEAGKVEACQQQVLASLQHYTRSRYPGQPAKFGELLLRIPELERACQASKESLAASRHRSGRQDSPSFNLLMELLQGDH